MPAKQMSLMSMFGARSGVSKSTKPPTKQENAAAGRSSPRRSSPRRASKGSKDSPAPDVGSASSSKAAAKGASSNRSSSSDDKIPVQDDLETTMSGDGAEEDREADTRSSPAALETGADTPASSASSSSNAAMGSYTSAQDQAASSGRRSSPRRAHQGAASSTAAGTATASGPVADASKSHEGTFSQELEQEASETERAAREQQEAAARRLADLRAMAADDREQQYQRAVADLQAMLSKAERFNAGCDALASESPFLCKEQPAGFSGGQLRDYQQKAVAWLSEKHWLGESCILADEMGLGKTVMIAAFVAWMTAAPVQDGPVLVVAPLSTLRNWVNEFRKFCPGVPVVEYHGDKEERAALRREHLPHLPRWAGRVPTRPGQRPGMGPRPPRGRGKGRGRASGASSSSSSSSSSASAARNEDEDDEDEDDVLDPSELKEARQAERDREAMRGWKGGQGPAAWTREHRSNCPVFITTYSIAMNDRVVLGRDAVPWGLLVVDESHRLKGVDSRLKQELAAYCTAPGQGPGTSGAGTMRVILTGTPLQNDLLELWSLCNFVMPMIFADREAFASVYGFLSLDDEQGRADVKARQERDHIVGTLHRLMGRYVLRRTKADVKLALPPKVECVVYCGVSEEQKRIGRALGGVTSEVGGGEGEEEGGEGGESLAGALAGMGWVSRDDMERGRVGDQGAGGRGLDVTSATVNDYDQSAFVELASSSDEDEDEDEEDEKAKAKAKAGRKGRASSSPSQRFGKTAPRSPSGTKDLAARAARRVARGRSGVERQIAAELGLGLTAAEDASAEHDAAQEKRALEMAARLGRKRTRRSINISGNAGAAPASNQGGERGEEEGEKGGSGSKFMELSWSSKRGRGNKGMGSREQAADGTGVGGGGRGGHGRAGGGINNLTMQLRKLSNHPFMFGEPRELAEEAAAGGQGTDDRIIRCSGKMQVLDSMLRQLRARGHKVLIFTQFVRVMELLADYMDYRKDEFGGYCYLEGSTGREERQAHIDRFNRVTSGPMALEAAAARRAKLHAREKEMQKQKQKRKLGQGRSAGAGVRSRGRGQVAMDDDDVNNEDEDNTEDGADEEDDDDDDDVFCFLLSTRAGGLGINLTAADTVIMFDSDWNPHSDSQAEDRAHRIGQTRPVVVYRLVTAGGVEESMVRRANGKRALERMVLQEGKWLRDRMEGVASDGVTSEDEGTSKKRRRTEAGAGSSAGSTAPAAAAASAASGAATPSTSTNGTGSAGVKGTSSSAGGEEAVPIAPELKIDRHLLERWLRFDLRGDGSQAAAANGITDRELAVVCDRQCAMQAGARLLVEVEGEEGARAAGAGPWLQQLGARDGENGEEEQGDGAGARSSIGRKSSPRRKAAAGKGRGRGKSSAGGIETKPLAGDRGGAVPVMGAGYEFVCHSTAHLDGLGQGGP